ncbi:hypothetical protein HRR83_007343 [Exophiala dermatitidis]|nr:hypothetical protein HRR74_006790 [Exophiala dermatitidis]KAJ4510748.1 hypothetical protein HRR73_006820 [Exophiala dermatitidis]KAJ4534924.1 hypothetical protein HRR76_006827 [Exophiala dermatitidis]KAJ4535994.1 hypothetical protein HRR77_007441 [Exophiala dermatitidis]KAJ4571009.1 hypothetical protein HRR79_003925 [Exophiala dermatitidis]
MWNSKGNASGSIAVVARQPGEAPQLVACYLEPQRSTPPESIVVTLELSGVQRKVSGITIPVRNMDFQLKNSGVSYDLVAVHPASGAACPGLSDPATSAIIGGRREEPYLIQRPHQLLPYST